MKNNLVPDESELPWKGKHLIDPQENPDPVKDGVGYLLPRIGERVEDARVQSSKLLSPDEVAKLMKFHRLRKGAQSRAAEELQNTMQAIAEERITREKKWGDPGKIIYNVIKAFVIKQMMRGAMNYDHVLDFVDEDEQESELKEAKKHEITHKYLEIIEFLLAAQLIEKMPDTP